MYGYYPEALRWRVDLAGLLALFWGGPVLWARFPWRKVFGFSFLLGYPVLAWWLLYGGDLLEMTTVPTEQWGVDADAGGRRGGDCRRDAARDRVGTGAAL